MNSAAFHVAPWSACVKTPEGEVRWLAIRAGFMNNHPNARYVFAIKLVQPFKVGRVTLSAYRLVGPPVNDSVSAWTHVNQSIIGRDFPDCWTALRWIEASFFDA